MEKQYFAVGDDVCRRRTDENGVAHEEIYVEDAWRTTTRLTEAADLARPITKVEMVRLVFGSNPQWRSDIPADGEYAYFAWADEGFTIAEPAAVIRTWTTPWGHEPEESCTPGSWWQRSDLRYDWHRGKIDGRIVSITEQAAERFRASARP